MADLPGLPCPQCGADEWSSADPGWSESFREWFRGGGWAVRSQEHARQCVQCGFTESMGGGFAIYRRAGWFAIPWRVVRTILGHRTMTPAPYIYLAALAIGVAAGVLLDALTGWPWWLVALGVLVAVWLVFLSSTFFGVRHPRTMRAEILDVVAPGDRWKRAQRDLERHLRTLTFPLYGLDESWTGPRWMGGWGGGSGETLARVELAHGDRDEDGPQVRVDTARSRGPVDMDGFLAAHELWSEAERPPSGLPPDLRGAWMGRQFEEHRARTPHWEKVGILLDGVVTEFDRLEAGDHWVARALVDGLLITVRARQFPVETVRLQQVRDVEAYLEGMRRRMGEAHDLG